MAARRGHQRAIDLLRGPEFPEALTALWEKFERLDAMRGVGMNGPERLTPSHIRDAQILFRWELAPHEVEALVLLDAVTLHPGSPKDEPAEKKDAQDMAWPTRKE